MLAAQRTLSRSAAAAVVAPRLAAVRFVSTATAGRVAAAGQPTVQASATKATISTTASASVAATSPTAKHIVGHDGRLKSSHRHFHANSSESTSGLNEFASGAEQRQRSKLLRMQEAKEMAGL